MRAVADHRIEYVVMMLARQMGKTEFGFNCLGWMWETCPAPALWIVPTMKLAYSTSRDRIHKMLQTSGHLWDLLDPMYSKAGSLERWVSGQRFGIGWAGSNTEIASHPAKWAFIDERSRMMQDAGSEGDPVQIVTGGTDMYADRKIIIMSSPTDEAVCPTYKWWLTGSKMRWCWLCPECGEWFWPCFAQARYPDKAPYHVIREESWMECPTCEHHITDAMRHDVEADYIPTVLDENGDLQLAPGLEVINTVASYWATGFSSPRRGIGMILERYARAERDDLSDDEESTVKGVLNTACGELWKETGDGVELTDVHDCQVDGVPDSDVQLITAGVDVQQDSLYYVVRGWCAGATSYLLDHGQLLGATEYDDVWLALQNVLTDTFLGLHVRMALIDSGYNTHQVYEVCRRNPAWEPSKGQQRQDKPFRDSTVDESSTGRARKTIRLWTFCGDTWKTWLYARLRWPKDKPGAWFVPLGIEEEFCQQVTNEKVRITRGRRDWYPTGNRRNHYMDCEILAAVAAHIQNVRTLRPAPKASQGPPKPPPRPSEPDPFEFRTL